MKLLIDTHAFLWIVTGGPVSAPAREAFLSDENSLHFSAASYWEICIKIGIGKLRLARGWPERLEAEMVGNGITWLPIRKEHCLRLLDLPGLHGDPFDRLLVGQAQAEGMTLLTADEQLHQYDVPVVW